jgi:hypothetical protein
VSEQDEDFAGELDDVPTEDEPPPPDEGDAGTAEGESNA